MECTWLYNFDSVFQSSKPTNSLKNDFNKMNCDFLVTYSWYHIRSNEMLSKNEEEVATKRSMENLKITMHQQT